MSRIWIAAVLLAGCAHAGMSESVRADINARMEAARPAITDCYAQELKLDRTLRGMMVLQFVAAPSSGAFESISVVQDDLRDPQLEQCVVTAVGGQKLATPQKTKVSVTYPLDFAPTK